MEETIKLLLESNERLVTALAAANSDVLILATRCVKFEGELKIVEGNRDCWFRAYEEEKEKYEAICLRFNIGSPDSL